MEQRSIVWFKKVSVRADRSSPIFIGKGVERSQLPLTPGHSSRIEREMSRNAIIICHFQAGLRSTAASEAGS